MDKRITLERLRNLLAVNEYYSNRLNIAKACTELSRALGRKYPALGRFDYFPNPFDYMERRGVLLSYDIMPAFMDKNSWVLDEDERLVLIMLYCLHKSNEVIATLFYKDTNRRVCITPADCKAYASKIDDIEIDVYSFVGFLKVWNLPVLGVLVNEEEEKQAIFERWEKAAENQKLNTNKFGLLVALRAAQGKSDSQIAEELLGRNAQRDRKHGLKYGKKLGLPDLPIPPSRKKPANRT